MLLVHFVLFPVLSIAKLPHPELPSPQFPEYFYSTFPISVYQWGEVIACSEVRLGLGIHACVGYYLAYSDLLRTYGVIG
jgi:hypothetical protein